MKILCKSCEQEGRPALIVNREPLDDATAAYGLCEEHWRQVEEEIGPSRAEG